VFSQDINNNNITALQLTCCLLLSMYSNCSLFTVASCPQQRTDTIGNTHLLLVSVSVLPQSL